MVRLVDTDEWGRQAASGNQREEDPRQRMIGKLQKLLAMSKAAATESEAAIAAAQLQRFLTEHNLSIADLERRGQSAPPVREQGHDLGKAAFGWKLDLAEGIAEFYYCIPLVDRRKKTVAFVGRPDNIEALDALYAWIIYHIKEIARNERRRHFDETGEHIDPLRWQIGFGEGAVQRLIERLKEMKARQEEEMSRNDVGDVTAMVLHHSSEASDYLEEKYGYRKDGKLTKKQQAREDRWAREREAKDEMRIRCMETGDMEPFYTAYPGERPDTPEEIARRKAADEKWVKEWEKREARNAKRRTGPSYREKKVDWDKEEQSATARVTGHRSADRINLQPFLGDGGAGRSKKGELA